MCTSNERLLIKQTRLNINGGKVIFQDRCYAGPNGESLVTNLSIQSNGNFSIWSIATLIVFSSWFYSLWMLQDQMLVTYISLVLAVLSCIAYLHLFKIKKELLTIIQGAGVQLTTVYGTGRKQIRFVDIKSIEDIVINEAVSMHKIVYYLAIILNRPHSEQDHVIIPVFLHSMPRLDTLTEIYQTIHKSLWKAPAVPIICDITT